MTARACEICAEAHRYSFPDGSDHAGHVWYAAACGNTIQDDPAPWAAEEGCAKCEAEAARAAFAAPREGRA